jgi:hypothetical protein
MDDSVSRPVDLGELARVIAEVSGKEGRSGDRGKVALSRREKAPGATCSGGFSILASPRGFEPLLPA